MSPAQNDRDLAKSIRMSEIRWYCGALSPHTHVADVLPYQSIRRQIADSINVVLDLARRGRRRAVSEVIRFGTYVSEADRARSTRARPRSGAQDERCAPRKDAW